MKVRNFYQLSEMLDSERVKFKMSKETQKYILGIGGSIDPEKIEDKNLINKFQGIKVDYDVRMPFKEIEFIPTFSPRIGDGFKLSVD